MTIKNKLKNEPGFSFMEIMIAISVIGFLLTALFACYHRYRISL